jgi:hypothetical protein
MFAPLWTTASDGNLLSKRSVEWLADLTKKRLGALVIALAIVVVWSWRLSPAPSISWAQAQSHAIAYGTRHHLFQEPLRGFSMQARTLWTGFRRRRYFFFETTSKVKSPGGTPELIELTVDGVTGRVVAGSIAPRLLTVYPTHGFPRHFG